MHTFLQITLFLYENFSLDKNLPSKQPTLANCTAHKTVFSKGIKMDFFLNDNLSLLQKHYKWHET